MEAASQARSLGGPPGVPAGDTATPPVFTDVTDEAGIRFTHSFGDYELTIEPEIFWRRGAPAENR